MKPHIPLMITLTLLAGRHQAAAQVAFAPAVNYPISAQCVIAADLNGDGKVDLVSVQIQALETLKVWTNNGSGGFVLASSPVVGIGPRSITSADINGDGKMDLISANYGFLGTGNTLSVLTNDGSGSFALASSPVVNDRGPISVVAADIKGDGKLALISANYSASGTLSVFTNSGGGVFGSNATLYVGPHPIDVTAADVNGDNKVDLICADQGNDSLDVLTNNGNGSFMLSGSYRVWTLPGLVVAADINSDGKVDLTSVVYLGSMLFVLTNNGSGGFVLAASPFASAQVYSIAAADVNGDGRLDLIAGGTQISVLMSVPSLILNRSDNNIIVSWPSYWTNWTLLQDTDLMMTNWSPCSGVADDGTTKSFTIPSPAGHQFFRLSYP